MRNILFLGLWIFLYFFTACASRAPVTIEENRPHFSNSRQFEQSIEQVQNAAKKSLQILINKSEPAAESDLRENGNEISSGWIYSQSKDKAVITPLNEKPKRINLLVRRKYTIILSTILGGSQATAKIQEEIQDLDKKTGQAKSWRAMTADSQAFADLMQSIQENIRAK